MQVAVKVLKGTDDVLNGTVWFFFAPRISLADIYIFYQRLLREFRVWSKVNHRNIMPLLGITYDFDRPNTPCLVSPYYRHSTIVNYLKERPRINKLALVSHIAGLLGKSIKHLCFSFYRLLRPCRTCTGCP